MQPIKKYGRITTSSNAPTPTNVLLPVLYPTEPIRRSFDENANPLAERGEFNTFASFGKSSDDGSLKRRKVTKKKCSELEKFTNKGHPDDIEFLKSQTEAGASHNLSTLGFYKLSFLLPEDWENARQLRCREWLLSALGFTESQYGNGIAFTHNQIRVSNSCTQHSVLLISMLVCADGGVQCCNQSCARSAQC
jgi:hypothetical protein